MKNKNLIKNRYLYICISILFIAVFVNISWYIWKIISIGSIDSSIPQRYVFLIIQNLLYLYFGIFSLIYLKINIRYYKHLTMFCILQILIYCCIIMLKINDSIMIGLKGVLGIILTWFPTFFIFIILETNIIKLKKYIKLTCIITIIYNIIKQIKFCTYMLQYGFLGKDVLASAQKAHIKYTTFEFIANLLIPMLFTAVILLIYQINEKKTLEETHERSSTAVV